MTRWIFVLHFAATWYLIGLCWLVQRVQYPLMERVGRAEFAAYEAAHVDRIGPIVAPAMLLEAATAAWLAVAGPGSFRGPLFGASLLLLLAIWFSTFLVQVPLHGVLRGGFDSAAHARLVATNWVRTLAWSARGALLVGLMVPGIGSADGAASDPERAFGPVPVRGVAVGPGAAGVP